MSEHIDYCKAYDAMAKSLLAHKEVLANILKYTVKEFDGYSIPEIISCLNGKPEIGTEPVDDLDLPPKMDVAGAESVSQQDGIRSYDIKFKVKIPGDEIESDLIINVESQNDYNPGYALEKRGIYYLSRLISSQYNVEFTNSKFDKLKKCYSIWICTKTPDFLQNTITKYSFKPENIVGNAPDNPQRYDLMSLIMINLGTKGENYGGLIKMLDQLLIGLRKDLPTAQTILENEFQIPFRKIDEEALGMCNLSKGVRDEGIDIGVEKGGILKAVKVVNNMLEKKYTLDVALEIADIDRETYEKYNNRDE